MKRRWSLWLTLTMMIIFMLQTTVFAANQTVTISHCMISGQNVTVIASGAVASSDSGEYYLFELKPYEAGIGARTDYCASAPAGESVQFTTALNFNTATSKLYSRFVVAVLQGGVFVPISNEMYITNPEAVATKATGYPVRSKKGLTADWQYASDLSALGAGYAAYELDISRFFTAGGASYTYNGKNYSFNSGVVAEYDAVCQLFAKEGVNVVMVIKNSYNAATVDLIPPAARTPGMNCYAMNVVEQGATEKIEALMSFLANRYSGSKGTIHTWIIGNEINNNSPWHYAGNMGAEEFAKRLQAGTEHDVRPTCIGHVQRGGSPSMADRMLAAQFGNQAVRLLNAGIGNRAVGIRDNKIIDMDIIEAVSMKKKFNYELYETLQMISM